MRTAVFTLIFALLANATANVLLRWGMKDLDLSLNQPVQTLKGILLNGRVMAGIVLFALNVLAYSFALSKIRLSVAYPVMTSLGLVIVMGLSFWFLGEKVTTIQLFGTALIVCGVVMVASQMS